ncbi:hypothetical protein A0256_23960 [Mucilaginibacter sp. PAMC 26640]|nr:hypothetical protein A0256_23960 [Mucilaginibacter sp. PAMC 26640]
MKYLLKSSLVITVLLVLLAACSKDYSPKNKKPNASLTGKWTYIGSKQSNGGPQYFVPAKNSNDYLQLNADGSMTWTPANVYKKYTIKDSVTITMTYADGSNYEDYFFRIEGNSLSLGPKGPVICIEGCSDLFVKK